uniref:uncharacterized protein LOC122593869 n=1 Tax=Erigeron canadensis TaxID=72917 RepID=UPI001CB99211|nr:uncharacterized protein LOC122593869 [Erigeron canadensis]
MSIAFETNNSSSNTTADSNRIQSLHGGMCIYNLPESNRFVGTGWSNRLPAVKEEEGSSSSSSIGNNSDAGGDSDGEEVNGPVNRLNDLEQVLPIKRGISAFYAGKSKSYGSLSDAVSVPSIQEIVKPEDAYSRKRKNMIAHSVLLEKLRKSSCDSGVSKRPARNGESSSLSKAKVGVSLPPLPRNCRRLSSKESLDTTPRLSYSSPWRSLSLSDLQHASAVTSGITGLVNKRDMEDQH